MYVVCWDPLSSLSCSYPKFTMCTNTEMPKLSTTTFFHLNLTASVLSLVYSFHYTVIPMIITNVAAGLFCFLMYYFKYIYEVKELNQITDIVAEAPAPMV
jgi:hypothetical protein